MPIESPTSRTVIGSTASSCALVSAIGGSVTGREHRRLGRNNQDAWAIRHDGDLVVGAVADGCGEGKASEVGAALTARWVTTWFRRLWDQAGRRLSVEVANRVADGLVGALGRLADDLAPASSHRPRVVGELLLTTVLVAAVDDWAALIFGVGDGLIGVDGTWSRLEAGEGNAPPYLGYRLLPEQAARRPPEVPMVHLRASRTSVTTLAVATDGCLPLLSGPEVGEQRRIDRLTSDARVWRNPSLLNKRLRVLGDEPSLLMDDATLVGLRCETGGRSAR